MFDVPGPCEILKFCRNELRTIVAYKLAGTGMPCKILSLMFVLNLEVVSGAFCFSREFKLEGHEADLFLAEFSGVLLL